MSEAEIHVDNTITGGLFFHAVVQGRDITVQLPPQITPALSGLPSPSVAFTGRDDLVGALLRDLDPGQERAAPVSVLAGLAGVGKTELALQVASRAQRRPGWFPGGVLFIDLFGYSSDLRMSPGSALASLLRALAIPGEHIPAAMEDRRRLYHSVLAHYAREGQRILVVVDNASTPDQARPLLPPDGVTAALVTSRHTLDGLDVRLHDLGSLDEAASVRVLDQNLRHSRGEHDTRITDDAAAAGDIARLCAGLPLALRIAAALLAASPVRPASSLADALRAEHSRLDALRRPDRAVRAAFDLSYRLLDDEQASLFRLLPLPSGPDLSTEAAGHLYGIGTHRAEDILQRLADAHLIDSGPVWGRWRMHDLVRLYARQLHQETDDEEASRTSLDRLCDYYQNTAAAASSHLQLLPTRPVSELFPDRTDALSWLDAERRNLLAMVALIWDTGRPAATRTLAGSLSHYLHWRRYLPDAVETARYAVAAAGASGNRADEASALVDVGAALQELRQYDEAADVYTRAVEAFRELGDPAGEATALLGLGINQRRLGCREEAAVTHTACLHLFRELQDPLGMATALTGLGMTCMEQREFDRSIAAQTQAVALYLALSGDLSAAGALDRLGLSLQEVRRHEEAADCHGRAAEIYRSVGHRHGEATACNNLGLPLRELGRYDEALEAHSRAREIFRSLTDRRSEAEAQGNRGTVLRILRRVGEAVEAHTEAVDTFRETKDRTNEALALVNLATDFYQLGEHRTAEPLFAQAVSIFRDIGDRHGEGQALNNLGLNLGMLHRRQEGVDALTRATAIYSELGDRRLEQTTRHNLQLVSQIPKRPGWRTRLAQKIENVLRDMERESRD
ncbi:tetratricopeptide repeat protein [Streptomyces collinus]|uniref:tetratricopeptide repeat protein n=1 Tax=Streptomyces collinus TaxID=42684 RepID=UPI00367788B2